MMEIGNWIIGNWNNGIMTYYIKPGHASEGKTRANIEWNNGIME